MTMIHIHFTGSFRSEDFSQKKTKLMLVRPLNSFIAGKLFPNFRSNILPERLGMARCKGALPRLYNSTTNNFAAGYQSTRSFVKLGNSSNTTEAPPIFVAHVCFFFRWKSWNKSPVDWVDQNTKWNQEGPLGPKPLWSRPKGVLL